MKEYSMGCADCVGQNRAKVGYIFDMRFRSTIVTGLTSLLSLFAGALHADPGDVESSRDYPGFTRPPGFIISDYDEDNPAEFDFPVAQPLPDDADHLESTHVRGHRYVIRYELGPDGHALTPYQTQKYYENLATDAGFTVEKSGAVGDVTETFYRATDSHQIWVYLEPAVTSNVLTVVESTDHALPPVPPRLALTAAPPTPPPLPAMASAPAPSPVPSSASTPPAESAPPLDPNDDSLFDNLNASGRVVLPFVFQPSGDTLDDSSQPLVDRVAAMMNRHPDLFLRIEGHTDNTGDPEDNLRLSAQRALAVEAKLIDANIDKKRLDAVGVGGLQPLASNSTAVGREKNRRIELVLWKKYPAFHPESLIPLHLCAATSGHA
jgi:outer membrane protein OmpA-like peptidoglycan-associated protein